MASAETVDEISRVFRVEAGDELVAKRAEALGGMNRPANVAPNNRPAALPAGRLLIDS